MRNRAGGFTLIEILIAIGILVVLVGIVAMGLSRVGDAARGRQAEVTLANLRALIAEFETKATLAARQPPHQWSNARPVAAVNFWNDGWPWNVGPPEPDPASAPGRVGEDNALGREVYDVVRNTQLALSVLVAVPANKAALGGIPMMKLKDVPDSAGYDESAQPGVPLDPWGHPIIFVPGGGLEVIMYDGNPPTHANPERRFVIRSPDGRPFWASAGPDGAFSDDPLRTGDDGTDRVSDNVYSF
jgi:prepilin-type N-terminal cleavage/methylation domain-containing protein